MRSYLVVDDNQAFAENLAEILGDTGASVDIAPGGAAALDCVRAKRYDALVSDMRMPIMSGAELVRLVRRFDPGLPVIVITAYTNDDDLQAARHEGLLAVLSKPAPVGRVLDLCAKARRDGLVVVVEDDSTFSDSLSEALRVRGFASVIAASVPETERLGDVHPFVALVDLRLPGGPDGVAMSQLADRYPGLPLLVMTAHTEVALPRPHAGLFRKPLETAGLLDAVEELYARRDD